MSPALLRKAWSRRGFRRVTYALAAGAVLAGSAAWTLRQPFFARWVIHRADAAFRRETGLGLRAEALELHPLEGRLVLRNAALGEDLLQVRKVEVRFNPWSMLGETKHIRRIEVEAPEILLDPERLARIRLAPRTEPSRSHLIVDELVVREGHLVARPPTGPLPGAELRFQARGWGKGPDALELDLSLDQVGVGALQGRGRFDAALGRDKLALRQGELRLGGSQLTLQGAYVPDTREVQAQVQGSLDAAPLIQTLLPKAKAPRGRVELLAKAQGPADKLTWQASLHGRHVDPGPLYAALEPGELALQLQGQGQTLQVRRLSWLGPTGQLEASGAWSPRAGGQLTFSGERVDLGPLASFCRVEALHGLQAGIQGRLDLPPGAVEEPDLRTLKLVAACTFTRNNQPAGATDLHLEEGRLRLQGLDLRLPEVEAQGDLSALLGHRSLLDLDFQGSARTDAAEVSKVLQAWGILPLDMSGQARAQARFTWSPRPGFALQGRVEVMEPRWKGARGDRLSAAVDIRDEQLRIEDIQLEKAEGRGFGELWLSWQDLPPGTPQIDMCYRACRLPIEEGMKAAGLSPKLLERLDAQGTGSGWARIHGPYDKLRLEGRAQAEQAKVVGLSIPAASADFSLDLDQDWMRVDDLRVAGSAEELGHGEGRASGSLALRGSMSMDLAAETWEAQLQGALDTQLLGLGGPRLQAHVHAMTRGPWTRPFGPQDLPEGTVRLERGRVFLGQQSLEGLEGELELQDGELKARLSSAGREKPLAQVRAWSAEGRAVGIVDLDLQPATADTAHLAGRLTGDLVRDARLALRLDAAWGPEDLTWQGQLRQMEANLDGFDLRLRECRALSGTAAGASLDLLMDGLPRTAGTPQDGGGVQLRLSGQLPFAKDRELGLKAQGSVDLKNLKRILDRLLEVDPYSLLGDMAPEGVASVNLALGGTYTNPGVFGTLGLVDGRLQVGTYPQSVEGLDFTLRFDGREIVLPESDPLRGTLAQGFLRSWGRVAWDFGGLSDYDLHFQLEDFQLRDLPEGFELQGDLDARLQGNDQEGGLLRGRLKAKRALYQADINLSDLILASAMGSAANLGTYDPLDPLSRIYLDLDLDLSEPWRFETNLLKLEGRPADAFKIQGTLNHPGLKGRMDFLPGGRLTNLLPAGDVVLERGSMTFQDPSVLNPVLSLQGRVDVPPFLVNLSINGTLDQLNFVPTSTPSLRQDEIISILVDPGLASSVGSGALTPGAMSYGVASTGSGLFTTLALATWQERIRKTLKLDRVSVVVRTGSAGTAETDITLGKTLELFGRRVPVVFSRRRNGELYTQSGQMEWRFGNVVLQLGVSQTGNTGLGLAGEIRHTWVPR